MRMWKSVEEPDFISITTMLTTLSHGVRLSLTALQTKKSKDSSGLTKKSKSKDSSKKTKNSSSSKTHSTNSKPNKDKTKTSKKLKDKKKKKSSGKKTDDKMDVVKLLLTLISKF
ncbi:hypothetical protein RclHR1_25520001 [Rhizophagus clarus]|uniref:Uncharacterized protein n=1 Tax=Rhizophagus clarus TaxID=94130 RepID=A0A2Z6RU72_9GLOM|nr:hypothetical protein RclHR1_25520001 [Rhizophagus clarus]